MNRSLLIAGMSLALVVPLSPAVATDSGSTVTGELTRFAVTYQDGRLGAFAVVETSGGKRVTLADAEVGDAPTGATVTVRLNGDAAAAVPISAFRTPASALASTVDVRSLTVDERPAVRASSPPADGSLARGSLSTTFQLMARTRAVRMVHGLIAGGTADTYSAAQMQEDVGVFAKTFWSDSTGGAIALTPSGTAVDASFTPTTADVCTDDGVTELFAWADAKAGVTPVNQGSHVVLYTRDLDCGFAGIAEVADGGTAWVLEDSDRATTRATLVHELGHTLTLGHANSRVGCSSFTAADGNAASCWTDAAGDGADYGNGYDVMGSAGGGLGLAGGATLASIGAFPAGSVREVTGSTTLTLAPVSGKTGVRFASFAEGSTRYYVELRGAVGTDSGLGTTRFACPYGVFVCATTGATRLQPGVTVTRVDNDTENSYATYLLDAGVQDPVSQSTDPWFVLQAGRTFTTATGAWRVTARSVGTSATLQFSTGAPLTPATPVVTSLSPGRKLSGTYFSRSTTPTLSWKPGSSVTGYTVTVDGTKVATLSAVTSRFTLPTVKAGWHTVVLRAANGTTRSASVSLKVRIDTAKPRFTSGPALRVRKGTVTAKGIVPATLAWTVTDNVGVRGMEVLAPRSEAQVLAYASSASSVRSPLGTRAWTLEASDAATNRASASATRTTSLAKESAATRTGTWSTARRADYLGGKALRSKKRGASLTHTFTGRSVGWVVDRTKTSGKATVYIDGHKVKTIDLRSSTTRYRQVVLTRTWSTAKKHTIKIVVSGTTGRPWVYSDGIAVIT